MNCRLCGATARFGSLCGNHQRMIDRDSLRRVDPQLSHREADSKIRRYNYTEMRRQMTADVKALRYVFPGLSYRQARRDVCRFNQLESEL